MQILFNYFFLKRFPDSKGERWENLFPTVTSVDEISLVNELVVYNPIKRLTASEV